MTEIQYSHLAEVDRERTRERAKEVATYQPGDRVTVEPTDYDRTYAGCHLEGALLTVSEAMVKRLHIADEQANGPPTPEEHRPNNYEERHVELEEPGEHATFDTVYISAIEYSFVEDVSDSMSETSLIPWEEYREEHDRVVLPTSFDSDTDKYLTQVEEGDECELCGCNMLHESHWDNGVVQAGSIECAACGDVKQEYTP